jgi:hypothetical protein
LEPKKPLRHGAKHPPHPWVLLRELAVLHENSVKAGLCIRNLDVEKRWKDVRVRSRDINLYFKKQADQESSKSWDAYRKDHLAKGKGPRLSHLQGWGRDSLKNHENLSRFQSTALVHFKTGFNGLNHHLKRIRVLKEADGALCACRREIDDVAHRLLRCPLLHEARKDLQEFLGHLDLEKMLTVDARVVVNWAIQHWNLAQFNWMNKHMPDHSSPPRGGITLLNSLLFV